MKRAKTLTYSVILKYIQSLNFNKRKTEDQILASLSTLEFDEFLKYNDNYDSYSLLIPVKELENEISNQPKNYASNPELTKLCGSLNSELDIGKLKDLLLKQILKLPQTFNDLIEGLVDNKKLYGYQSCPCRLASGKRDLDRDLICPCDYAPHDVKEYGACYCNLYMRLDFHETINKEYINVPERRPTEKEQAVFEWLNK